MIAVILKLYQYQRKKSVILNWQPNLNLNLYTLTGLLLLNAFSLLQQKENSLTFMVGNRRSSKTMEKPFHAYRCTS